MTSATPGARTDAQHRRAGQRVGKDGLQQKSGRGKRRSADGGGDGLRQTRLQHYELPRLLFGAAAQHYVDHLAEGDVHAAHKQVGREQQRGGHAGRGKHYGVAIDVHAIVMV